MRIIDADVVKDAINEEILKVHEFVRKPEIEISEEMKIRVEQEIATYCEASLLVSKAPTVDAVLVKHAKWIRDEFGTRCGACGLYAYRDKFDQPWESPYCPTCGARMDKDE